MKYKLSHENINSVENKMTIMVLLSATPTTEKRSHFIVPPPVPQHVCPPPPMEKS